jgi:transposase InsO family protein
MIKNVIFPHYRVPRILISDGGTHYTGNSFRKCLYKLGIEHRVAMAYHPQTNGQAETSNRKLKSILNKTVEKGGKDWSKKLDEALWAYQTAHKTPIGMTPYQFIYGKSCHLPLELEHKAYWEIKEMNLDVDAARIQISELEEMRLKAYESTTIYKERMKRWYDKILQSKEFKEGDKVLPFNSKFKIFRKGKLKSK